MIAFPVSPSHSVSPLPPPPPSYEEWGYAEQAWYLERRMGLGGVLRALFWASSGVVEVGLHEQLWSQRTPQPPADQFTFHLSENGYVRLRHYLEASKAARSPILKAGGSEFYRATDSYHVFHNCHHYAAGALRAARLPISTFWALTRGMLAAQLRGAEQMVESVDGTQAGDHDGALRPRGHNRSRANS